MGHTAVLATSVTIQNWQNGAKEKYCNFATLNMIVDTRTEDFANIKRYN